MEPERPQILGLEEKPPSVEIARKIIDQIRSARGHIDATDEFEISKTSLEWQEGYRRDKQGLRELYARYTKTVSDQLYTSKYRFIYEVLQNADDSEYTPGSTPTITFRIKPNELVIETNETGFIHANVQAICATGESSKLQNVDTTGEKGLGFKSVFGVASRVHIQSGHWSFRFEHRPRESGLGMVTPIWTSDPDALPAHVGTRFTLSYTSTDAAFVHKLVTEFDKVHETTIFALRKLKKIVIAFDGALDRKWTRTIEKSQNHSSGDLCIEDSRKGVSVSTSSKLSFKVFSTRLTNLPVDEIRRSDKSIVTIAFQIDYKNRTPVIPPRGQHVFAYLPIQRLPQLPFLIQADFVLAANREAVPEGDWNLALRDGVAQTFNNAVLAIVRDTSHPLRFEWVQYLPTNHIEGFWEPLYDSIKSYLAESPIVQSRRFSVMQKPRCLREVLPIFLHAGEPLLRDLPSQDVYVSAKYNRTHLTRLTDLGLQKLSMLEMVDRLSEDLRSSQSLLRTRPLKDAWHTSFRQFVSHVSTNSVQRSRIRRLEIIPLSDNTWTYADCPTPIYFPILVQTDSVCIQIPGNLGLRKLDLNCCADTDGKAFYRAQGVSTITPPTVIQKILIAQKLDGARNFPSTLDALAHLEILFWFGEKPQDPLWASDQITWRRTSQLYFPSSDPFHAQQLLGKRPWKDVADSGLLESRYLLESNVRDSVRSEYQWQAWLEKFAKVRYFPTLSSFKSSSQGWKLNSVLAFVALDDPMKFLSNLKTHWQDYSGECFAPVVEEIKVIKVPCRNGLSRRLMNTILPTQSALSEARKYGVEKLLPFLNLATGDVADGDQSWDILVKFGVCCVTDRVFYIKVLKQLATRQSPSEVLSSRAIALYTQIGQNTTAEEAKQLKDEFADGNYIYIPSSLNRWVSPKDCVWRGPKILRSKHALEGLYGQHSGIKILFGDHLSIPDSTYHDIMNDLELAKPGAIYEGRTDISELYNTLNKMVSTAEGWDDVRVQFDSRNLIKVEETWIKPADGIWNCTVELSGKVPLEPLYPTLRDFFVAKLSVKVMHPVLLLEEIANIASRAGRNCDERTLEKVKNVMRSTGQILTVDRDDEQLKEPLKALKRLAFLPVRGPKGLSLQKLSAEVFIVNQKRYGDAFKGKINLVDFSYEDMTLLLPLFQVLGLEDRYLSEHVRTETAVENATTNIDLTNHFRNRAYALSCCAVSHRSTFYLNQDSQLHDVLLDAEVLLSENMNTKLIVTTDHGATDIEVDSDRSLVKVTSSDRGLKIYVPSDSSLISCYRTELPSELVKILGIEDLAATKKVLRILIEDVTELETVMSHEDIPKIAWLSKVELPETGLTGTHPTIPTTAFEPSTDQVLVSSSRGNDYASDAPRTPEPAFRHPVGGFFPPTPPPSASPDGFLAQVLRNNAYKKLLEHVVSQARNIPHRYRSGSFSMTPLPESLMASNHLPFHPATLQQAISSGYQGDNFLDTGNTRVGAAGELFVFELLKALSMPNFTIDNWQSKIRANVKFLDDYSDLVNWSSHEVSDIMYAHNTPEMKEFLRNHSHNGLPRYIGNSEQIQYLIEVKTTTGPCNTPFLMSKNQYQLMRQHTLTGLPQLAQGQVRTVYVIMRVYNLGGAIGLEMYVDPWALRDNTLEFVAGPWKVIPPVPRLTSGRIIVTEDEDEDL